MTITQIILYPFTLIYKWITDFRNYLYDIDYKKSFLFDTKVINVGNITVGGTGKTPHVEYLIRFLKEDYKIATLSRGYGRKSKGFILADEKANASMIGDEPMQFYQKFASEITVTVGEERIEAIPKILYERPETQVILLDDAYQHRAVIPDFNILLTDYSRLFYKDFPFPSGRLRESRKGAKRADAVIVSKCPVDLAENEKKEIISSINQYTKEGTPIYFTSIKYGEIIPVQKTDNPIKLDKNISVLLFSGIAKAQNLENYVSGKTDLKEHLTFSDHHFYTIKELGNIKLNFEKIMATSKIILTTEKDAVKIKEGELFSVLEGLPVYYLPIEIYFQEEEGEESFRGKIMQTIKEENKKKLSFL